MSFVSRLREWWNSKPQTVAPTRQPTGMHCIDPEFIKEFRRLKEQADWLGGLVSEEEMFTYGLDGTLQFGTPQYMPGGTMFSYPWAYSQCLFRPNYGACFFINEAQHRMIRARSRAFTSINPYWHGCQHNLKTHIVGKGHTWILAPLDPLNPPAKTKLKAGQRELDKFYWGEDLYSDYGPYHESQMESVERKSRDGEQIRRFLMEGTGKEKHLRVRFVEPLLLWTPESDTAAQGNEILFGVQYRKGDYEKPLRYHILTSSYFGSADPNDMSQAIASDNAWTRGVDAMLIQHRKRNVDRGCPRGIPDTYWVQSRLEQSLRTLRAMGTLVQVRTKIAMIRKRMNALVGAVQPMLSNQGVATVTGPSGDPRTVMSYADGSIIDTNDNAEYQFPASNIEADKIVSSVQADLQAAATSLGLADYMVSGNLTKGSFATAMVAEGPVVKTFEQEQQEIINDDKTVAVRVLQAAAQAGRIDGEILESCTVEMNGPPLAGRNAIQEAQANQIKVQCGVLSITTWQKKDGLNPETEEANKQKNPSPLTAAPTDGGTDGTRPRNRQTSNARPFNASEEPRQQQRASGATREEQSQLQEGSYEPHPKDTPTPAELAMAEVFISEEWLEKTKGEIQALPSGDKPPREWSPRLEYEPGVQGVALGHVADKTVIAVDATAVMVAHETMDFVVAGNHMRWDWIPSDTILVDWSYPPVEAFHDILHELVETRLMAIGRWSYAMAHKIANHYEKQWLLVLRPELNAIKPQE